MGGSQKSNLLFYAQSTSTIRAIHKKATTIATTKQQQQQQQNKKMKKKERKKEGRMGKEADCQRKKKEKSQTASNVVNEMFN